MIDPARRAASAHSDSRCPVVKCKSRSMRSPNGRRMHASSASEKLPNSGQPKPRSANPNRVSPSASNSVASHVAAPHGLKNLTTGTGYAPAHRDGRHSPAERGAASWSAVPSLPPRHPKPHSPPDAGVGGKGDQRGPQGAWRHRQGAMEWSTPRAAQGLPAGAAGLAGSRAHPRAPEGQKPTPPRPQDAASAAAPGDRHLWPGRESGPAKQALACAVEPGRNGAARPACRPREAQKLPDPPQEVVSPN